MLMQSELTTDESRLDRTSTALSFSITNAPVAARLSNYQSTAATGRPLYVVRTGLCTVYCGYTTYNVQRTDAVMATDQYQRETTLDLSVRIAGNTRRPHTHTNKHRQ